MMAKLNDDPISASDLVKYLESQDDFDLELSVYRAGRVAGLHLTHGGSYDDPVTRKARQYDIRASQERGSRRIDFAIECKALKPSYPLLVSRIPRTVEESFHEIVRSHRPQSRGHGLINPGPDNAEVIRQVKSRSLYPVGDPVGKSTAQVGRTEKGDFKTGDREVYDKWSQALASASDMISNAIWAYEKRNVGAFLTVIIPALVVSDDSLWVADYSDNGKLVAGPKQVDETTIYVAHVDGPHMGPVYTMSHLHVYTRSRIADVLSEVGQLKGIWETVFAKGA